MNILIEKPKNGKFTITVSVDPIEPRGDEEFVDTRKIKEVLRGKNIPFGECLKSSVVSNTNPKTNFGEWVFALPEEDDRIDTDDEEIKPTRKRRSRRKVSAKADEERE